MADNSDKRKLTNEEKIVLIKFYQENPPLWDSSKLYYKNKENQHPLKFNLVELFNKKNDAEILEKTFHSVF